MLAVMGPWQMSTGSSAALHFWGDPMQCSSMGEKGEEGPSLNPLDADRGQAASSSSTVAPEQGRSCALINSGFCSS